MKDYELTDGGDIRISNGDKVLVEDGPATAQRIKQKLSLWRGEWFLDARAGFPWLQDVLGQRVRPEVLQSLLRDVITRDPGIRTLEELNLDFENEARRIEISFRARATDGEIIESEVII
jgi:hypothetical protein